ncbi:MAG TPA: MFS transporter [Thermoguttaceae bacterium]|nr:MFS transporter [Thermoguttaceae bacterium]
MSTSSSDSAPRDKAWFRQLNGYHWLVLSVCTAAWAFDCLSQQIFNLTRKPAMDSLTDSLMSAERFAPLTTTALMVGWATGGIIFGILGDRIGRAKTMTIMILCFSISTGLCGLSVTVWDYLAYCFVMGVGAGGIFPIGCTLVAESLPDKTRSPALGMMQTFSAVGNVGAGLIALGIVALLAAGVVSTYWRWLFSIGIIPSLLAVIVASKLREPDVWKRAVAEGRTKKAGLGQLFAERRWRRNAIVGLLLAASGVVGLWSIGVFSNDLTQLFVGSQYDDARRLAGESAKDREFVALALASSDNFAEAKKGTILDRQLLGETANDTVPQILYKAAMDLETHNQAVSPEAVLAQVRQHGKDGKAVSEEDLSRMKEILASPTAESSLAEHVARIATRQKARNITVLQWAAVTLICFNIGAFFGMYAFAKVSQKLNRRPTFAIFFTLAMVSTAVAFAFMSKMPRDLWMVALMGGAQLSVFGGYAIYFPELFPTRLRSTGTSFCYNVGRYLAAFGPLTLVVLKPRLITHLGDPVLAFRYAGVVMCSCYLVGLAALLFAPETKDQPLPE